MNDYLIEYVHVFFDNDFANLLFSKTISYITAQVISSSLHLIFFIVFTQIKLYRADLVSLFSLLWRLKLQYFFPDMCI